MAEKLGIFHIQFEEFLQEKLMLKTEKNVGPEFEDDSEDEQFAKQEIEELAIQANVTIEEENTKKLVGILILSLQISVLTGVSLGEKNIS